MNRRNRLVADGCKVCRTRLSNCRCDKHLTIHILKRKFKVKLTLGLMQSQEATFASGCHASLVLGEHLVVLRCLLSLDRVLFLHDFGLTLLAGLLRFSIKRIVLS